MMSNTAPIKLPAQCDVAIVGGGPSGLAAATELKKLGVESVVVLEREAEAGGIPRHCGHSPFGMREFKRIYNGRQYTQRLSKRAIDSGVVLSLNTSVIALQKDGKLSISTPSGSETLHAKRVIICTGIRETPRATRLISGQRPLGVMTTGALQSMIYLKGKAPFKRPLVIGSELVSFSALLSCRHAGMKPVAMIETGARITAKFGMQFLARGLGVPIHYHTQLVSILGKHKVTGAQIETAGDTKTLECDGVIFTGKFVAESSLLRMSHLEIEPVSGNPIIDQFGRCSDPHYFATGNMTHPIETAGYCWRNGVQTAKQVYASLRGELDHYDQHVNISLANPAIKYVVPQMLAIPSSGQTQYGVSALQIRLNLATKGRLSLNAGDQILAQKNISALPERRVTLGIPPLTATHLDQTLELQLHQT